MTNETAILAGGCFWGMEDLIRKVPGVIDTQVGYSGGTFDKPTYNDMKTGKTGHAEALKITYDPAQLSYEKLLQFFFQIHDPSTPNRQGNDRGTQYRSVIMPLDDMQREVAARVIDQVNQSGKWPGKVVTEILPVSQFYDAEDYHQDYLEKNKGGYTCHYIRPDWTIFKD